MSAILFIMSEMSYRFEGAWYPKGGAGALTKMLTEVFLTNGGIIKLETEVRALKIENKSVRSIICYDKKGKKDLNLKSKYIISNIDLTKLVNDICIPNGFSIKFKKKINQRETTYSSIVVSLGIDLDLKELGFNDYELWRFYKMRATKENLAKTTANFEYENTPIDLITCYSNIDPSCCPEGKSVVSIIYYSDFEPWKRFLESSGTKSKEYYQFKDHIAKIFIQKVEKALDIENLGEKIEVVDVATPLTFFNYTYNRNGSNFGWRLNSKMQMTHAIRNKTKLKNLFLCGQWVIPGASISATSLSGFAAASRVLKKLS